MRDLVKNDDGFGESEFYDTIHDLGEVTFMSRKLISKNDKMTKPGMGGFDAPRKGDKMLMAFDVQKFADRQYDFARLGKPSNGGKRTSRKKERNVRSGIIDDAGLKTVKTREATYRFRNANSLIGK